MDDIKLFKLVTSEEIVAVVVEEDENCITLRKPRLCTIQQGKDAEGNVGNYLALIPWIMYATDPEETIERDVILYKSTIAGEPKGIPKRFMDEYLHESSGIIV